MTGSLRRFWDAKSKIPYPWKTDRRPGITWIGFLGYQMKRDGTLRVRRSSIEKEVAKQRLAVDDIIRRIDRARSRAHKAKRAHRVPTLRRIRYAAMMHLVSIGVGYPSDRLVWPAPNSVCWASGFRLLRDGKTDLTLLRALDRGRGIALRALTSRLDSLMALPGVEARSKGSEHRPRFVLKRDGRPLSYYSQFAGNPRIQ